MKRHDCEVIRLAAMALADGEKGALSAEEVQAHVAHCAECRGEMEALRAANGVLDAQSRRTHSVDLWPRIETRLKPQAARANSMRSAAMLVLLVVALLSVRGIVLTSALPMEWMARLGTLVLVLGWFVLMRENPFTIHSNFCETNGRKP